MQNTQLEIISKSQCFETGSVEVSHPEFRMISGEWFMSPNRTAIFVKLFDVLLIMGMEQAEKLSRTISETFVKFVSFVVKS